MGTLTGPGSFPWLVAHDLRLNWRRFEDMMGGGAQGRALLIALAGGLVLHALAWPTIPLVEAHMQGPLTSPESRLGIGALLICVASWMMAQGLFAATRTLYDRGDLDLLYGSPMAPRRILAAKATAIALSSLGSVAMLALPVANVGAIRLGPHWLAVYPTLAGIALLATALALAATVGLFHAFGPQRARLYAQMGGAFIGGAFVLGAQIVALLPDAARDAITQTLAPSSAYEKGWVAQIVWLPVDAITGDVRAMIILMMTGVLAFVLAAAGLGDRFAFSNLLLAKIVGGSAIIKFLLTFSQPLARTFPLGFQVSFLRCELAVAAIKRRLFGLQPIGQLSRVLT